VINNTVDNFFFKQAEKTDQRIVQILHVSCFDEQAKNLKGMLNAVKVLSEKRTDFKITLIGTGIDFELIYNFAQSLNFPEGMIEFMGEKMPTEVAEYMQHSDFFVLFSNYENSPVVISESLACGKPVISSNVGGISEHINSSNGILIAPRDEEALAESIDYMLDHFSDYKSAEIQSVAKSKFSMEAVGKEIYEQYLKALKLKHNN
jgi:glycosyltransferase involved in cell wall biosynthesis